MPNLKEIMDAMEANWKTILAVFLASTAILVADHLKLDYLQGAPEWARSTIFIVAVFTAAILVVSIIRWVGWLFARLIVVVTAGHRKRELVEALRQLPSDERYILIWAKSEGRQAFTASQVEERLVPLITKGYIRRHSGTHSILDWPYSIHKAVWDAIDEAFDEIPPPNSMAPPIGRASRRPW